MLGAILTNLVLLSVITSPVLAQSQGSGKSSDEWKFTLAPYLLFPRMDGTTAIRGRELEVDVSAGDIFSNLQFGGMGYFEARKARWGVGVDAVYMALGTDVDRPSANVDFNQGAYTFTGQYQLHEKVDFLFGARWNVLQGKLDFKEPPFTGIFKDTKQWVDPIVGLKFNHRLGGRWSLTMEGDIGGFGAGSKFAWQLFPVLGVDVGKRATLKAGYRVLGSDYHSGSGKDLFRYEVITQGIVIGAAFHF